MILYWSAHFRDFQNVNINPEDFKKCFSVASTLLANQVEGQTQLTFLIFAVYVEAVCFFAYVEFLFYSKSYLPYVANITQILQVQNKINFLLIKLNTAEVSSMAGNAMFSQN